ncbi:hypothetical protein [Roseibium sp.]
MSAWGIQARSSASIADGTTISAWATLNQPRHDLAAGFKMKGRDCAGAG